MSGIAAIVRFDGGNVEPGHIEKMTAAMDYRGIDGIAHWSGGQVALGHCMLRTTPESLEEAQPLTNEDQSLVLVMDGYIANYAELRSELLSRGARLRDRSEAELMLRAYEAWREDCPKHIDGEYAFLVWDARRREVFCARDHAGMKPLHYHWDGKRLAVASDIAAIMACADVEREPNPLVAMQHISGEWFSLDETIWKNVMRLQPAHGMTVDGRGLRITRHWLPSVEVTIRYKREEDYYAHYRELLADCVKRASRTHLPLGCEVSGGLDSSAVYCVAEQLRSQGDLPAPALKGYTYVFEPGSDADEVFFARAVARHTRTEIREIEPFFPDLEWFAARSLSDCDVPPLPNAAMAVNIGKAATEDGCRVVLNGEGGDEFLRGGPLHYAEDLAEREWTALWRSLREDLDEVGLRQTVWRLARFGIAPLAPEPVKDLWRRLMLTWPGHDGSRLDWLPPELQAIRRRQRAVRARTELQRMRKPAQRLKLMSVFSGFTVSILNQFARQCARLGYQLRSPMFDRKFIEFALATPEHMRMRKGVDKFMHVRALDGLLPPEVVHRTEQIHFNVAFERLLDAMELPLLKTIPRDGRWGLTEPAMRRMYEPFRTRQAANPWIGRPWGIFASECPFMGNSDWVRGA